MSRVETETLGLFKRKCSECGKDFESHTEYVYKRNRKGRKKAAYDYFCSYSCMRKWDKRSD